METIAERYDRHAAAFAATVAGVPGARWDDPSPCEDWSARDVVRHVVETHGTFAGLIGRELPTAPDVTTDPVAAFAAVHEGTLALLRDPATAEATYEGHLGVRPFAWAIDTFQTFDLVVHRWDLAQATGQAAPIDAVEVERLMATVDGWGEMARGPGVLGPPRESPPGADPAERLLAYLGRPADG